MTTTTITHHIPTGTCHCGCGDETGKRSWFRPGHDARMAGAIGREIAQGVTDITVTDERGEIATVTAAEFLVRWGSEALATKAARVAENSVRKPAPRKTKPERPGRSDAPAEPAGPTKAIARVGRRTFGGEVSEDGTMFTYEDNDGNPQTTDSFRVIREATKAA